VLRRFRPIAILGPALLLVTIAAGLLIEHVFDGVQRWDMDIMNSLVDSRTSTVDRLTDWGTWLAETIPVLVITALVVVIARLVTHRWTEAIVFAAAIGTEKLVYLLASLAVGRDRPPVPTLGETYATSSFPSGHVGSAVAMYGGIALVVGMITGRRALQNVLFVVAGVLSAVVAYCRMYRGFHYPSDVIAGALMGAACLAITWYLIVARKRSTTHDPASPPPSLLSPPSPPSPLSVSSAGPRATDTPRSPAINDALI
jgi:membrane-associated phospholipid phosphatase